MHKGDTLRQNIHKIGLALSILIGLGFFAFHPATAQNALEWSEAVNLGPNVNSASSDYGPAISKNGLSLYISSDRGVEGTGANIWVSQRASLQDPWGPAVKLGPNINSGTADNLPSFSRDGHLMFFSSSRPGGFGDFDIWVSWRLDTDDDFGWQSPANLGPGVNSQYFDAAAHFFEDENDTGDAGTLYFTTVRPAELGGLGGTDIFSSKRASNGSFGPAALVPELSTPSNDARPNLLHHGLKIFFYSNRPGSMGGSTDLWSATRNTTLDPWSAPVNLGAPPNGTFSDIHPAVSFNGRTIFFSSNRPGGIGGSQDNWMTTRTGPEED